MSDVERMAIGYLFGVTVRAFATVAVIVLVILAIVGAVDAHTSESLDIMGRGWFAEDSPLWDCETMGNLTCGSPR